MSNDLPRGMTLRHFIESNKIEDVFDEGEVPKSILAWVFLDRQDQLSHHTVRTVHDFLMTDLIEKQYVGVYRVKNVEVGGNPCPYWHDVWPLMDDWLFKYNSLAIDPKQAHIEFEHIHPFIDGNGRVGRMLLWWHETRFYHGNPTLIQYANRDEYYSWF